MQTAKKIQAEEKKYTYADYLTWGEDNRCEIIDGVIYDMSPAPSNKHQFITWEIAGQIRNFLLDKAFQGRFAPFDVRFSESVTDRDKIVDVVQPDLFVVCDASKLDDKGCQGAPDFIIEILSPSTAFKDFTVKHALYEKNRVTEYWIVDPVAEVVIVYLLDKPTCRYASPSVYRGNGRLGVASLEGLEIDLDMVFRKKEAKERKQN